MSKLTKEEKQWFYDKFYNTDIGTSRDSFDAFLEYIEQKKKEWQELAVAEYRLKKEVVTKFYGSGLD